MERPDEIRELSSKCREAARGWGKERSIREFQEAFKELVCDGACGGAGGGRG